MKKTKDLKFASTNISVSFLRPFSNFDGLKKETKILVETIFRSFIFLYYHSKMLLLVILFAIKLLAKVNILQLNITSNAVTEQTLLP